MVNRVHPRSEYLSVPSIIGLKAEYEAEGATFEEIARLLPHSNLLPLGLTVKIGGCEAVTDLRQALTLGPKQIVAPMVESTFAAKKFGLMMRKHDPEKTARWLINVETVTTVANLDPILEQCKEVGIDGVVVGRGDLAESMDLERHQVDDSSVFDVVAEITSRSSARGLIVGIGGGVTSNSLNFLQRLASVCRFDYFETRKVLISPEGLWPDLKQALAFELSWLEERASEAERNSSLDFQRIEKLARSIDRTKND